MKVPVDSIQINSGRRETDRRHIGELAASMAELGLLNPITIDQGHTLIAGLHRLEAAKLLGWTEIDCTVTSLEGLQAELAEIDENMIRHNLDYPEEGEQLARRKEIYETLHPETRQGKRNGQTSKTATSAVLGMKPFTADTAEKIGMAERTIGHTVNFKTTKKSCKSKKVIHNSQEEQVVYENTQPALIDQDSFDRVQSLRVNSRQRHIKCGEPGLFSGLLFCADCGSKMYHHRGRSVKTEKEYYTCGGYSKRVHPCTTHHITLKVLKQLVMADLQRVTQFAAEHEKQFVDMLVEDSMQEQKRAFAEMQRTLDTQRARYSELDIIIQRLYEDNIKGKLSDERFAKMSAGYEAEQAGLSESIQQLTALLSEKKDKTANISRFLSLVKRNLSFEDLTRDVLNTFIQKIVVHEVDKSSGQRVQKIDIYYNFVGKIEGA